MSGRSFYFLVGALWLGNILPALDATLVGTALPTVIGSLDGLSLYSWVFAAYLLALTVSIPIFGKLSDLFGRKPVYFFGMSLFILGSLLSTLVQSVEQLIFCRVLVGIGTGSIGPASGTIMGDALPIAQRAKVQWIFASAWVFSSIVGPAVSSAITIYLSWRFVFLASIPLGLLSCYLLATQYHENVQRKSHQIDYLGVALLGSGVLALLFALSPTSRAGGIDLASGGSLLALSIILLVAFLWNESRVAEPVLPPRLFLVPVLGIAALGNFASGVVQSGATSFIPIFVQGAQGGTAADVGLVLPWLTIGWPIGSGVGGAYLMRIGFRRAVLLGMACVPIAQVGLLMLDRDSSPFVAAGSMFLMGLGFGVTSMAFMISAQNSVRWNERGVATASLQFFRSIGGSIGVAVMGTIVTMRMQPLLEAQDVAGVAGSTSALLNPASRSALPAETLAVLQMGMSDALHQVFLLMAAAAVISLFAVLWFPNKFVPVEDDVDVQAPAPPAAPARS